MSRIVNCSRRDFLKTGSAAGAGLVLGFYLPAGKEARAAAGTSFQASAWIQIALDGKIKHWAHTSDLGQGARTALPMILADELEADWASVEAAQAPFDPRFGEQGTGGSTAVRTSWEPLRKAGATAREMLREAAAQMWKAEKSTCRAERGSIVHTPTGRRLGYGALAEAAAKLPVPKDAPLKEAKEFRYIGKGRPRVDAPAKTDGAAKFGIDVRLPGMLFATVARCPVPGGKFESFDVAKAKAVPGVKEVLPIGSRIAIVADTTWAAFKGREALESTVKWDAGPNAAESSGSLRRQFDDLTGRAGKVVRNTGDVEAALAGAAKRVEATYELPYVAHAPLEPPNCTAHVQKDKCEVWAATQSPGFVHDAARRITGLPAEAVRVNVVFSGGAFGRRWFQAETEDAVEISKAVGAPVQVVWTREDDIQHGFYRPASFHRLSAGLDAAGWPVAWRHRYAATSIQDSVQPGSPYPEAMELGGAVDIPYPVPNVRVEFAPAKSGPARGWLRSVEHTYTAFVVQSFIDELAAAAGKDPYEYRMQLLREPRKLPAHNQDFPLETARLRGVLELAAAKAGWGTPLAKGRGRGIAHHYCFDSYVAEVAEVSVSGGAVRVDRVVAAVDCGTAVNPDGVRAQIEGGIILGLTAALKSEISLHEGRVEQSNFHDYPLLQLAETPAIEVHIVPSELPPTGVGEPGVPPIAPAVTNAIFAATGKRIRRLPVRASDFT